MDFWRDKGLGTIIAERRLYLDDRESVWVRIGAPITEEEKEENPMSGCPYQIDGIGSGKVRFAFGEDRVQALWLVLQMIGADLYFSDEYKAGRLKAFPDSSPCDDLHFPVPKGVKDLLPQRNDDRPVTT
jgi:hypothetical protein